MVCLYYNPEGYTLGKTKIMGRQAAGESFLTGILRYSASEEISVFITNSDFKTEFLAKVESINPDRQIKFIDQKNVELLRSSEVLYYPGPDFTQLAFQRSVFGNRAWSCCGVTHTTASKTVMDELSGYLTAPVMPWDALICTSDAVKTNVLSVIQTNIDYLKERLAIKKVILPQLPVIPLGIDASSFSNTDGNKQLARHHFDLSTDDILILYVGRLSFHAKAHPLAMYRALEEAQNQTDRNLVLLELGWHANDAIKNAFKMTAEKICPSVRVLHVDGRVESNRKNAWSSADIFCSLADNIQETFGLTPLEAMASGLPAVVSDWNGYKETIRHETDGFLIPTIMPKEGMGTDLALRHAMDIDTYDMYCGYTSSLVSVDVVAATKAIIALASSSDLRKKMGDNARKRAANVYDWSKIIPQYEDLWNSLVNMKDQEKHGNITYNWPTRPDPFKTFNHYATESLEPYTKVELSIKPPTKAIEKLNEYKQLLSVNYANYVAPTDAEISKMLNSLATGSLPAIKVVEAIPENRRVFTFRAILWLLKLDILKLTR